MIETVCERLDQKAPADFEEISFCRVLGNFEVGAESCLEIEIQTIFKFRQ